MLKKFCITLLLVLCTTMFAGCATIEYQHIINADGLIEDTIVFEIDKSINHGLAMNILGEIQYDVQKYFVTPVEKVRDNMGDINIAAGIAIKMGEINPNEHSFKVSTFCVGSAMFDVLNKDIFPAVYKDNKLNLEIEDDDNTIGVSVSAFIIKYIEQTTAAFGDISEFELKLKDETMPDINFAEKYSKKYAGGQFHSDNDGVFDASDIKLKQMYVSPDTRLKSNADETMLMNGYKFHLWELDASKTDRPIIFYYQTANSPSWYYLALGITAAVMITIISVYFINRKKAKLAKINVDPDKLDESGTITEFKDFDDSNKDF